MDKPKVGVGVLIFDDHNRILLGKRQNAHGTHSWAPPGGHLEFGESFEECAMREVREETGLNIDSPQFITATNDVFIAEQKHYVSIFMKAKYPNGQKIKNSEPDKVEAWEWSCLDNLPSNLFLPLKNLVSKEADSFKQRVCTEKSV